MKKITDPTFNSWTDWKFARETLDLANRACDGAYVVQSVNMPPQSKKAYGQILHPDFAGGLLPAGECQITLDEVGRPVTAICYYAESGGVTSRADA